MFQLSDQTFIILTHHKFKTLVNITLNMQISLQTKTRIILGSFMSRTYNNRICWWLRSLINPPQSAMQ